jgi:hypothetical protein
MQDEEMKIDVGETDEQEQEIDLDAAPQEEQPEEKPEVEVTDKPAEPVKAEEATEQTSEMENYSKGVKARIASLTKKMREAERQREEAITFAKGQQAEVERMKKKYSSLDETYTNEFEKRVTTNVEAAKAKLAQAIATGNIDDQVAAQTEIATLAMEANRLGKLKELQEEKTVEQPAQPAQPKVAPPPVVPPPDPKADAWAQKNTWFGVDNAMTYTAFDIHKKLVEEEGFDPASDEYYTEVDKRIRLEFPHKFDTNSESTAEQPVQNVASAKRPATKGRRKTVKLTPSQVAISKRLGVPLEEYAKQLIAKEV